MNIMQQYQNWRLEIDEEQILWLYFDKKNASVNTIDFDVMNELSRILDLLAADNATKGLIITSAKSSGFIAGADITLFNKFKDIDQAVTMLKSGQDVFAKLENLKIPTVALISGFCLGGGLDSRLPAVIASLKTLPKHASDYPKSCLASSQGGAAACVYHALLRVNGMDMVLSGRTVSAKAAAKMGFVDAAVPTRQLLHAARYYIRNKPAPHKPSFLQNLTNMKYARQALGITCAVS